MNTSVSEAHAGEGCSEQHLALGFEIIWVSDGTWEVLDGASKGMEGKDVGYRISALIGRAVEWIGRARRAFAIRDSCV